MVKAYFTYSFFTSALFYPVLAHAVWSDDGWASPKKEDPLWGCGVIDYAGSGVVHMLGGGIGLLIARQVKAREGRFFEGREWHPGTTLKNHTSARQINEASFRPNDPAWMTLGCFLLWLGWYGFNCGSGLKISTTAQQNTAGHAAMNTTIGAAVGCVASMVFEEVYHIWSPKYRRGRDFEDPLHRDPRNLGRSLYEVGQNVTSRELARIRKHEAEHSREFRWPFSTHKSLHAAACNGMLAGLVGITAGCATMSHWSAIGVSIVSALVYHVSYRGVICFKIDDAVNASAVHLFCGCWGLIAAGFTATDTARSDVEYPDEASCPRSTQFATNAFMAAIIIAWASVCTYFLFLILYCRDLVKKMQSGAEMPAVMDHDLCNFMEKTADQFEIHIRKLDELEESQKKLQNWIRDMEGNFRNQRESILNDIKGLQSSRPETNRRPSLPPSTAPGSYDGATPGRGARREWDETKDTESGIETPADADDHRKRPEPAPLLSWFRVKSLLQ
ncbi:unnamed protein product [Ascophyllum nodosum]